MDAFGATGVAVNVPLLRVDNGLLPEKIIGVPLPAQKFDKIQKFLGGGELAGVPRVPTKNGTSTGLKIPPVIGFNFMYQTSKCRDTVVPKTAKYIIMAIVILIMLLNQIRGLFKRLGNIIWEQRFSEIPEFIYEFITYICIDIFLIHALYNCWLFRAFAWTFLYVVISQGIKEIFKWIFRKITGKAPATGLGVTAKNNPKMTTPSNMGAGRGGLNPNPSTVTETAKSSDPDVDPLPPNAQSTGS